MSQVESKKTAAEKARDVAWKSVKDKLSDSYAYNTSVQEEESQWVFTFLPQGRVRGGGATVKIDKLQMTVIDVTFLQ
jgi:hypothetical protein